MIAVELTLAALLALLLIAAAATDAYNRTIPNGLNLAILMLAPGFWWVTHLTLWPGLVLQFAIAAAVFLPLLGAFKIGQMGGGDVKMFTAIALVLPPLDFLDAFVGTAMIGGVLTSIQLIRHTWQNDGRPFENPYGISIALGTLVALGGRYGYLPETAIIAVVTPLAILGCLAAFAFRMARRISATR